MKKHIFIVAVFALIAIAISMVAGVNLATSTSYTATGALCIDSDGNDHFVKGNTTGKIASLNGSVGSRLDSCTQAGSLVEFLCDASDYVISTIYDCHMIGWEYYCSDGICAKNDTIANQTCTDSDLGINYSKRGVTTGKLLSLNGGINMCRFNTNDTSYNS